MVTVIFIFFLSIYVEAREWGLMIKISLSLQFDSRKEQGNERRKRSTSTIIILCIPNILTQ